MAHDVFISYSTEDRQVAHHPCRALEDGGVHCWIAPRDVQPGNLYGEAILKGINGARVFVLIFSTGANRSIYVQREVERGVSLRLPIVTYRIEEIEPSGSLAFFLGAVQSL